MEGPSLYILAQELQIFVGQKIIKIAGNARFEKKELRKQTIQEIYSYGKRLIIQLDSHALATHFLMYGSYRIDEQRPEMEPRLAITTPLHELYFYNCSVHCFAISNLKNKLHFEYDILSPQWDIKKVVKAAKAQKNQTIDDVLLDQDIFAGVGNIIKNEVLFISKVKPTKKISQLTAKKLIEIAENARKFSQKFLELRKKFELKKNLEIYRKKTCPVCQTPVTRKKTGKRNRWSYFCPKCQK